MDFLFPHGFKYPPDFHIPPLTGTEILRVGPFSYTNSHFTMLLVGAVLVLIAWLGTRQKRDVPSGIQNAVEMLVQGLEDFVVSIGGTGAKKYLPLFGTLFLFIVLSNWLSITPFFGQVELLRAPTSDYHVNFALALVAFVAYQTDGFRKHGLGYASRWFNFSGFKEGVFVGLILVLVGLIELFSEIFRILTLTLRLWGNVWGGEIVLAVLAALLFVPSFLLPFLGLELFIGFIQAFVFAFLVLLYIVLALESHGGEEHEGSHEAHHAA